MKTEVVISVSSQELDGQTYLEVLMVLFFAIYDHFFRIREHAQFCQIMQYDKK